MRWAIIKIYWDGRNNSSINVKHTFIICWIFCCCIISFECIRSYHTTTTTIKNDPKRINRLFREDSWKHICRKCYAWMMTMTSCHAWEIVFSSCHDIKAFFLDWARFNSQNNSTTFFVLHISHSYGNSIKMNEDEFEGADESCGAVIDIKYHFLLLVV